MSNSIDRRNFNKLTAAALGGLSAGALAGCGKKEGDKKEGEKNGGSDAKQGGTPTPTPTAAKHLCRGLNDCKGQGATGKNECRGQGKCATVEHHACGGKNSCKGLGGCGETVGKNECKGKGKCQVPLMDKTWKQVRADKEAKWKAAEKKFGEAPPKPAMMG